MKAMLAALAVASLATATSALAVQGSSKLTIRYVPPKGDGDAVFRGVLKSNKQVCVPHRRIRVKRVRQGPDQLVGSDLTGGTGRWKVELAASDVKPGRYYAKTRRKVVGDVTCLGARTSTVRVRG